MSLIDQDHLGTWGDAGLIVEAPEQNVLITSAQDCGAHNFNLAALEIQSSQNKKLTGDALLVETGATTHNEVVAQATRNDQRLILKGFFYKMNSQGLAIKDELAEQMRWHARRLGLPIIGLKPLRYDNEIKMDGDKLTVTLDNVQYNLTGGFAKFDAIDLATRSFRLISPQQMEKVNKYLRSCGLGDDKIADLHTRYTACVVERQKARARFDADGNVQEITKHVGFGDEETLYSIEAGGYAVRVNLADQAAAMNESSAGRLDRSFAGYFKEERELYIPLSRLQVEGMAEEASASLSDAQKDNIKSWLGAVLSKVEERRQLYKEKEQAGYKYTELHIKDEWMDYLKRGKEPATIFNPMPRSRRPVANYAVTFGSLVLAVSTAKP